MNSKSLRILHLFCLLLHLSVVCCEPPEEGTVQRFVRHSQPKPLNPIVKELKNNSSGPAKVDDFVASPSVTEVKVTPGKKNHPGTYKILVGNWVAQWDSLYRAWFYYNAKTDHSTWDKPKELVHLSLNPPKGMKPPSGRKGNPGQKHQAKAEEKFIESSQNNFFGFNTETVKDRSLFDGLFESVKYLYESIIEDYMGDVFTDVIEGYVSATISLIGWFIFGSMLVVKGAIIDHYSTSGKGYGRGRMFGDAGNNTKATFSLFENFELTFPIENTILTCYKERTSCVENDFQTEFDYLLTNIVNMKNFVLDWLELGENIGHLVVEGGDEF